jgi:hypothetical protein
MPQVMDQYLNAFGVVLNNSQCNTCNTMLNFKETSKDMRNPSFEAQCCGQIYSAEPVTMRVTQRKHPNAITPTIKELRQAMKEEAEKPEGVRASNPVQAAERKVFSKGTEQEKEVKKQDKEDEKKAKQLEKQAEKEEKAQEKAAAKEQKTNVRTMSSKVASKESTQRQASSKQ